MNELIQRINQFKQMFSGNPQDTLNRFIQQNNIPQSMLDEAQKQAKDIYEVMKRH